VLAPRAGDANIRRATVLLPAGEYLDQSHIRKVCSTARFAAGRCPAGSIYGWARAWSPVLDRPLAGPVYLRSSNRRLPALAADLSGEIHLVLRGSVDSIGGRLRARFAGLPDVPLNRVELAMKGGNKGLLVNSEDLCAKKPRATAGFTAHNNATRTTRPKMVANCGKKRGKKGKSKRSAHTSTTAEAISACRSSLVGTGTFSANVKLPEQSPFPSEGKVLAFNGRFKGRPAILAHIYGTRPVPTSYVLPFTISRGKGFAFEGGKTLTSVMNRTCKVKG
jgi:hypothetical protein